MIKLKVILGSVREGRAGEKLLDWSKKYIEANKEFDVEYIDLKDYQFPMYRFAGSPAYGPLDDPLVEKFRHKIADGDAFIMVTPEYNRGYPASLKNAIDHVYNEWNNKPVAFISYGGMFAGDRAVEQLRIVAIELQMAPIREQFSIPLIWQAFDDKGELKDSTAANRLTSMVKQLEWWATTLKAGRHEMLLAAPLISRKK